MKITTLSVSLLVFLACLASCGKKTKVKDSVNSTTDDTQLVEDEGYLIKDLKTAFLENDVEKVKELIKNNDINLNQVLPGTGETLLTFAISKDLREIRNFLLEKGADPEKFNLSRQSPLFVAVKNNDIFSVKVLAELKVNLDFLDLPSRDTPLLLAIRNLNSEIAMFLIKEGANLETLDKKQRSPLRLAEEKNLTEVANLIRSLLQMEAGAPDLKSFRTLLADADVPKLNSVLSKFPRLAIDYESINPLAILVEGKNTYKSLKSAELLLRYDANVNGPQGAEETPLIKATLIQKKDFANLFLASKANPQLLDKDGKSALIHAIELNNLELVDLLLSFSAVEKYTFRRDGEPVTYSACRTARKVNRTLKEKADKEINFKIRKSLDCRIPARFL